jgi:hypothetical protein
MRRFLLIAIGLIALPHPSPAQYVYPGGYGRYGFGGGGSIANDPAAGYMAGLGAFARGQGVYQVENAKAQAINLDTMLKWNKALRARQKELRVEQQKDDARREVERQQRLVQFNLENGTTLNNLLMQILEFDPAVTKASKANAEVSAALIREIPFEWDTEAITICIDQLTARESIPTALADTRFLDARNAVRRAVEAAIKEEAKGSVSPQTAKAASDAVDQLHDQFVKNVQQFSSGYDEASDYFSTLASLIRLLNDPSMKKILADLTDGKPHTLGEVIAFMNAFNLKFGPATSPRQVEIYVQLEPVLASLQASFGTDRMPAPSTDKANDLKSAAKGAFSGLKWDQLQAHAQSK